MANLRALAVCVATISVTFAGPVANAVPSADQPAAASATPAANVVTLITGDRVAVVAGVGQERQVTVEPGPGRENIQFLQRTSGHDRLRVIPVDAVPLLDSGRLDPRLFDVSALIRAGYDDRAMSEIPVLVSYPAGVATRSPAIAGATTRRLLSTRPRSPCPPIPAATR